RYKDQFTYSFEVDESLLGYLIPKITIQPFIENSLYHGIERMADEGRITIRVVDDGPDIVIQIEDDGTGIPSDTLERIQRFEVGEQDGIVIRNVNERLQLLFGDRYGVNISSELDEGTVISITIPKTTDEGEPAE